MGFFDRPYFDRLLANERLSAQLRDNTELLEHREVILQPALLDDLSVSQS